MDLDGEDDAVDNEDSLKILLLGIHDLRKLIQFRPWRCNLVASSNDGLWLFVASVDTVVGFRSSSSFHGDYDKVAILAPSIETFDGSSGYIMDSEPFAINAIKSGFLGTDEVLVSVDDSGHVQIWFLEPTISQTDHSIARLTLTRKVRASAWGIDIHAHRRLLAISSNAHDITIFRLGTNEECEVRPHRMQHDHNIPTVAFNASGTLVAGGSIDNTCVVWDVDSAVMLYQFVDRQWVWCVKFLDTKWFKSTRRKSRTSSYPREWIVSPVDGLPKRNVNENFPFLAIYCRDPTQKADSAFDDLASYPSLAASNQPIPGIRGHGGRPYYYQSGSRVEAELEDMLPQPYYSPEDMFETWTFCESLKNADRDVPSATDLERVNPRSVYAFSEWHNETAKTEERSISEILLYSMIYSARLFQLEHLPGVSPTRAIYQARALTIGGLGGSPESIDRLNMVKLSLFIAASQNGIIALFRLYRHQLDPTISQRCTYFFKKIGVLAFQDSPFNQSLDLLGLAVHKEPRIHETRGISYILKAVDYNGRLWIWRLSADDFSNPYLSSTVIS